MLRKIFIISLLFLYPTFVYAGDFQCYYFPKGSPPKEYKEKCGDPTALPADIHVKFVKDSIEKWLKKYSKSDSAALYTTMKSNIDECRNFVKTWFDSCFNPPEFDKQEMYRSNNDATLLINGSTGSVKYIVGGDEKNLSESIPKISITAPLDIDLTNFTPKENALNRLFESPKFIVRMKRGSSVHTDSITAPNFSCALSKDKKTVVCDGKARLSYFLDDSVHDGDGASIAAPVFFSILATKSSKEELKEIVDNMFPYFSMDMSQYSFKYVDEELTYQKSEMSQVTSALKENEDFLNDYFDLNVYSKILQSATNREYNFAKLRVADCKGEGIDTDGDGVDDNCDSDKDGDGIINHLDSFVADTTPEYSVWADDVVRICNKNDGCVNESVNKFDYIGRPNWMFLFLEFKMNHDICDQKDEELKVVRTTFTIDGKELSKGEIDAKSCDKKGCDYTCSITRCESGEVRCRLVEKDDITKEALFGTKESPKITLISVIGKNGVELASNMILNTVQSNPERVFLDYTNYLVSTDKKYQAWDKDDDGIINLVDNCLLVKNEDQENGDSDSFGDACDFDSDGDLILNYADKSPDKKDSFGFKLPEFKVFSGLKRDTNVYEAKISAHGFPSGKTQGDQKVETLAVAVIDELKVKNEDLSRVLKFDDDTDKDGIKNDKDKCPKTYGMTASGCPDTDGDSIIDDLDNCPLVYNYSQHDEDGDRIGDVCDMDAIKASKDNNSLGNSSDEDGAVSSDGASSCSLTGGSKKDGTLPLLLILVLITLILRKNRLCLNLKKSYKSII
ncbi:MAG: thrombospondin type 3 repeat-containing protein [Pseudomonadota bacterium]